MKPIYIFRLDLILDSQSNPTLHRALVTTLRSLRHYSECWFWTHLDETQRPRAMEWGLLYGLFDLRTTRWWDTHPERFQFRRKCDDRNWHALVEGWLKELPRQYRSNIVAAFDDPSEFAERSTAWEENNIPCYQVLFH